MDLNEQIKTELEELGSEFCTAVLFVGLRLFKESRMELAQEHFNSRSFRFSLSSTVPTRLLSSAGSKETFCWSLAFATRECDNDPGWASPCFGSCQVHDFLSVLAAWPSENELNKLPVWAWHLTLTCWFYSKKKHPRPVAGFQSAHKSLPGTTRFPKSLDLNDAQETCLGRLSYLPLCCPCLVFGKLKAIPRKSGLFGVFLRSGVQVGPGMEGGSGFTLQRTVSYSLLIIARCLG